VIPTLLKQYWWIILIVLALIVIQLLKGSQSKEASSETPEDLPYVLKRYLMSKAERSFLGVLEQVTDSSRYYIFPQVSLNNVVTVEKGTRSFQAFHNKVDRKSVDFVLFDRSGLSPVLAIELDDSSHEREDRQERDAFVDRVLAKAGLPLLHVKAKATYDPKELTVSISEAIRR
jgi:hypothetical protein